MLVNLGLMKIRLVSASDLFFLLSADAHFIPVHRTGFSDAVLIKRKKGNQERKEEDHG